ncbi:MAG: hypothetical protein ABIE74_03730 [Pseudomonadota bacterium]
MSFEALTTTKLGARFSLKKGEEVSGAAAASLSLLSKREVSKAVSLTGGRLTLDGYVGAKSGFNLSAGLTHGYSTDGEDEYSYRGHQLRLYSGYWINPMNITKDHGPYVGGSFSLKTSKKSLMSFGIEGGVKICAPDINSSSFYLYLTGTF